jgi:hypothetical protein
MERVFFNFDVNWIAIVTSMKQSTEFRISNSKLIISSELTIHDLLQENQAGREPS